MAFDFNDVPIEDNAAKQYRIEYLYADFTDVDFGLDTPNYDPRGLLSNRGCFSSEEDFYILNPSVYFKLGHFSFAPAALINNTIFMSIAQDASLDDLFEINLKDVEKYPIAVFQYHKGEIKHGDFEVSEDELRQAHCLNDMVVFKGVFFAEKEGDGYRLHRFSTRLYFNWVNNH